MGSNGRIAGNFQRTAAVDGHAQIAKEGNASRAGLDMPAHLITRNGFYSAIQILGEVQK